MGSVGKTMEANGRSRFGRVLRRTSELTRSPSTLCGVATCCPSGRTRYHRRGDLQISQARVIALIYTLCATDLVEPRGASPSTRAQRRPQSTSPGSHDDAIGRFGLGVVRQKCSAASGRSSRPRPPASKFASLWGSPCVFDARNRSSPNSGRQTTRSPSLTVAGCLSDDREASGVTEVLNKAARP